MSRATIPSRPVCGRGIVALLSLGLVCGLGGCDEPAPVDDGPTDPTIEVPAQVDDELQHAELRSDDGIVDGDTFRLVGFDATVRPLCIDTEEVPEDDQLRRARRDWEDYRRDKTENAEGPRDYGTPFGIEATEWAREFFDEHGPDVWLEYPAPQRTRGYFDRHLAYLWVREGGEGEWLNFNVEAVRAGMTPYYTNFGRCDDYDEAFRAAQRQARDARRGLWDPQTRSYRDYDRRLRRWEERADQIDEFRDRYEATPGIVEAGTDTTMSRLRHKVGRRAVVFGAVDQVVEGADPPRLELFHRHRRPLRVETGDGIDIEQFGVDVDEDQFVYVLGTVRMFRGDPVLELDAGSFIQPGDDPPAPVEQQ